MSSEFSFKPGQLVNDFYTNSHGFLSAELPYVNTIGAKRVLYLGDSFLVITPFKYHFVSRIENLLREALPGQHIESINLGISSVGTSVYRKALEVEGVLYKPDVVVVAFFVGNDFTDDEDNQKLVNTKLNPNASAWVKFLYTSKLAAFLMNTYKYYSSGLLSISVKKEAGSILGRFSQSIKDEEYDPFAPLFTEKEYFEIESSRVPILIPNSYAYDSIPLIQENFRAIKATCDLIGSKLLVVVIPDEMQVNADVLRSVTRSQSERSVDTQYPQKRITDLLKEEYIPYIDLLAEFEKDASPSSYYQPRDTHFNSQGNHRVAELISPVILDLLQR